MAEVEEAGALPTVDHGAHDHGGISTTEEEARRSSGAIDGLGIHARDRRQEETERERDLGLGFGGLMGGEEGERGLGFRRWTGDEKEVKQRMRNRAVTFCTFFRYRFEFLIFSFIIYS